MHLCLSCNQAMHQLYVIHVDVAIELIGTSIAYLL